MKRVIILFALFLMPASLLAAVEQLSSEAASALVDQAKRLPAVQEFLRVFPKATIATQTTPTSSPYCVWTSDKEHLVWLRIGLCQRHILEMSVLLKPTTDNKDSVQSSEPHFFIAYVSAVTVQDGGRLSHIAFAPDRAQTLSLQKWRDFIDGGNSFEKIGVTLETSNPLPDFAFVWPGEE